MNRAKSPESEDLSERALQPRLRRFLSDFTGQSLEIHDFRRCSSGFSWMTFSFRTRSGSGEQKDLILQVGPHTGLLAPYSARPQALTLQALAGGAIPVAELIAFSDDDAALGAPFFVCSKVAGEAIVPWGLNKISPSECRGLAEQMIDSLGALHRADAPVGALAGLFLNVDAKRAATAEMEFWVQRVERWRTRSYPILAWAGHWLRRNAPAAPRVCIAHGDFRLGNFLAHQGRVTAVLDWEMVHLGHPHEDLGWLLLPMYNNGSRKLFGALTRQEALERYTARSGIPVDEDSLHYFECLAMFKSIAITMAGMDAYVRRGFDDMRMASMGTRVASLTQQLDKMIGARK